ncbi:MAG: DUF262 domain-containing protein [Polyangiaceae bacterium]|nr:DUF262 domain-containing protein [Polyangiaceae bacterium]
MGNGLVYRVPPFQRDYSWTEEEWDDLWQDIVGLLAPDGESAHYMGYLVLQTRDERNFDVIDGQQRLTTLSVLILAVLKNLHALVENKVDEHDNTRRIEELRKTYIGFLDPVTLLTQAKLTLNRHNDSLYRTYLVPLSQVPRRGLNPSEKLLRNCFLWFEERVRRQLDSSSDGADYARLVDTIADRLFFTVISVADELNAFKVFETLNARGVRLSSTDLLKNYLFSVVHAAGGHEREMRELDERWEAILGKLGSESVQDFLRVFWNSQRPFVRQSELFKVIRAEINDRAHVFDFLRELDGDADTYAALYDPHDPSWTLDQQKYLSQLHLFGVRQQWSLLLAARRVFDDAGFTQLLRACVVVALRYNVIAHLAPGEQEKVYNEIARFIATGSIQSPREAIRALKPIYLNDSQFRSAFEEKALRTTSGRNKRVVRYILFEVERHVSNHGYDPEDTKYNIEHILPEHPEDGWDGFTDDQADRCRYRLGNMTLLNATKNRKLGTAGFAVKREVFAQSEFGLTKRVSEYEDWTEQTLAQHQKWLAKQATSIWRIAELS